MEKKIIELGGSRRSIPLRGDEITIGRSPENDLVVDDKEVSLNHARIIYEHDEPILEDLQSRDGTFVDQKRIQKKKLQHGAIIKIGSSTFQYVTSRVDTSEKWSVEEYARRLPPQQKEITITIKSKYSIEFEVSGKKIKPGEPTKISSGLHTINPSLKYLPALDIVVGKLQSEEIDFDSHIPKVPLTLECGFMHEGITIQLANSHRSTRVTHKMSGSQVIPLWPGSYNILASNGDAEVHRLIEVTGEKNITLHLDDDLEGEAKKTRIRRIKKVLSIVGVVLSILVAALMIALPILNDNPVKRYWASRMILVEGGPSGDFYISPTEVTFDEYDMFCKSTGYVKPKVDSGYRRSGKMPVVAVNVADANAFCDWLSKETGTVIRLPEENEWVYAARGGNKSKKYEYSGSNAIDEVAWHEGNSGNRSHEVATKQPNELGIYDMSGNAWEWCGTKGAVRGGSWYLKADYCLVSHHNESPPDYRHYTYGFRILQKR